MDREEIKTYLPHREPMLLIDTLEKQGDSFRSTYRVRGDEFFLQGHFPDYPVVPGVILCELMAQACALVIGEDIKGKTPYYAGLDKIRFKRMVRPGDTVDVVVTPTDVRGNVFIVEAKATVAGELCCKGIMKFVVMDHRA